MAIVDAQRLVTCSGEVVGVTAKLRTPQRLSFKTVEDPPASLGAAAPGSAGDDAVNAEIDEAIWAQAACQDYLFGMAVKPKVYFSFQEATDDFARWGLEVVWGEDVPTNVVVTGP